MDRLPWALRMDALWKMMGPRHEWALGMDGAPLALEINRLSAWMGFYGPSRRTSPRQEWAFGMDSPWAWMGPRHGWALGIDEPTAWMGPHGTSG